MKRCSVCNQPANVHLRLDADLRTRGWRVWHLCYDHARAITPRIDRAIQQEKLRDDSVWRSMHGKAEVK